MKSADRLPGADHLDLGVVVGPRPVAQQVGRLAPHRQQVLEDLVVGGPGDVVGSEAQLAAGVRVGTERREGDQVGIVGGDPHQTVVAGRVRRAVVVGQAGQPLGGDPDRADVVADVAAEVLGERDPELAELAQPVAGGVVAVHAGAAEVAQRVVEHPARAGVESAVGARVESVEDGEQVAVLAQLGDVLLDLLAQLVGPVAHGGIGVHLRPQRDGLGVGDGPVGAVPRSEHLGGAGGAGLDQLDLAHGLGELALAPVVDPREPVARPRKLQGLGRGAGGGGRGGSGVLGVGVVSHGTGAYGRGVSTSTEIRAGAPAGAAPVRWQPVAWRG